jgi:hypothetical protein
MNAIHMNIRAIMSIMIVPNTHPAELRTHVAVLLASVIACCSLAFHAFHMNCILIHPNATVVIVVALAGSV